MRSIEVWNSGLAKDQGLRLEALGLRLSRLKSFLGILSVFCCRVGRDQGLQKG